MNDLIACIIIYNEVQFLHRCLASLYPLVDGFIIVDGAFDTFPHEVPWSDDGTLEIISKLRTLDKPVQLIECKEPWANQVAKRNEYLKYLESGDWMFQIDGDEEAVFLSGALDTIKQGEYDGYAVEWVKQNPKGRTLRIKFGNPRIIRVVPGMHYAYNHYSLFDGEDRNMYLPPYRVKAMYDSIKILHWNEYRDEKRRRNIDSYYAIRREYASGIEGGMFVCCGCDYFYYLNLGELLQCPRCGYRRAAAHPNMPELIDISKPWMSEEEVKIVNCLLEERQPRTVLEFGSGGSTVYFPRKHHFIEKWSSIEHSQEWHDHVKKHVCDRVDLRFRPGDGYYTEAVKAGVKYDMILVDGQLREICLVAAKHLINPNGFVLLHDSMRKLYGRAFGCYGKSTKLIDGEIPDGEGHYKHRGLMVFEE